MAEAGRTISELEIFHSRPVVPTRRIALGRHHLTETPIRPNSQLTAGGLLLAAIVGRYSTAVHPDMWDSLESLINRIALDRHIPQPYLRFRLQTDRVGLAKSTHALINKTPINKTPADKKTSAPPKLELKLGASSRGSHIQQLLGALYAVKFLEPASRASCISAVRLSLSWWGTENSSLLNYLLDADLSRNTAHPKSWALQMLGIETLQPTGAEIQRQFRQKLWDVHPDRGGDPTIAPDLIHELAEARRMLLVEMQI